MTERLKELFDVAKQNGIVHNQSQFAKLLQTDEPTMSICLKGGNKKYATTTKTLVSRAELSLTKLGIELQAHVSIPELQNTIRQQQELIDRQQREIDGLYERIEELKSAKSISIPKRTSVSAG